ncbi:MAG: enoyl-CoA hydratase/isomerase family protein [Syntrophobacteraceae bacterium]
MNFESILTKREDKVLTITLNRPQVLNAMHDALKAELRVAIEDAATDDEVRCIVLTGIGKSFSTGNDLKDALNHPTKGLEGQRQRLRKEMEFACLFWDSPKPVIAAVNGFCLGSACEMALACDITLAAESATFGVPEIRQSSGAIMLVEPWIMGLKNVKELLFTGDTINAREAERIGMVNHVVPDGELMDQAHRMAKKISLVPAYAVELGKLSLNRTLEIMGFKNAMLQNIELMAILHATDTPERVWFRDLVREKGMKEALKARAAKFKGLE